MYDHLIGDLLQAGGLDDYFNVDLELLLAFGITFV